MYNKEVYFLKQARYWLDKFGFRDWKVQSTKSNKYPMGVFHKTKKLKYHPEYLYLPNHAIMLFIFHEIGHIYNDNFNHSYVNNCGIELSKIMSEYLAEKRAFYWLKKYYPSYYKKECEFTKNKIKYILELPEEDSYYFLAYSQVPEYNKNIEIEE